MNHIYSSQKKKKKTTKDLIEMNSNSFNHPSNKKSRTIMKGRKLSKSIN